MRFVRPFAAITTTLLFGTFLVACGIGDEAAKVYEDSAVEMLDEAIAVQDRISQSDAEVIMHPRIGRGTASFKVDNLHELMHVRIHCLSDGIITFDIVTPAETP